jgi:hypothetical protein
VAVVSLEQKAHSSWIGEAPEADNVGGTITIPEVAHDTEASEYVVCSLCRFLVIFPSS